MLRNWGVVYFTWVLLAAQCLVGDCRGNTKLSNVHVLLPYTTSGQYQATYNLVGYGGCFKWTSLDREVVHVEPLPTGQACSDQARITVSKGARESIAMIQATDPETNDILECKCRVAPVASIDLNTKSKYLNRDELEVVEVEAKDKDGNTFSNVTGLRMKWTIEGKDSHQKLRIVKFEDHNVAVQRVIQDLEAKGHHSSKVLLQGQGNGTVTIVAELDEPSYPAGISTKATFTVFDPFQLFPQTEQYILPGSSVQYRLEKRGKPLDIPNEQYKFEALCPQDTGAIEDDGLFKGSTVGACSFTVTDMYAVGNFKSGTVHVVAPTVLQMTLGLRDQSKTCRGQKATVNDWHLLEGAEYVWDTSVGYEEHAIDGTHHKMSLSVDSAGMTLALLNSNGWQAALTPQVAGIRELQATFAYQDGAQPKTLKKTQKVTVVSPVRVQRASNAESILLLDEKSPQKVIVQATGGSGLYSWTLEQGGDIAELQASGSSATVLVKGEGIVSVRATDEIVCYNFDAIELSARPLSRLEFKPYEIETEVGNMLTIPLNAYVDNEGEQAKPLVDCKDLSIVLELSSTHVFHNVEKVLPPFQNGLGCVGAKLVAHTEGHATLTATYKYGKQIVQTNIHVFSYHTPRVVTQDSPLLTVGSSFDFVVNGGPLPWPLDRSRQVRRGQTGSATQLPAAVASTNPGKEPHASKQYNKWTYSCEKEGVFKLQLSVGNEAIYHNIRTITTSTTATVVCQQPHSLVATRAFGKDVSAGQAAAARQCRGLYAAAGSELTVRVELADNQGRVFDNATATQLLWHADSKDVSLMPSQDSKWQTVKVASHAQPGVVTLTASAKGGSAKQKIDINVVGALRVQPAHLRMLLHPPSHGTVSVLGGSGNFKFATSDQATAMIDTSKVADSHSASLAPVGQGSTSVVVQDQCLVPPQSITAKVDVVAVAKLTAHSCSTVEVGGEMTVYLHVTDNEGMPVEARSLAMLVIEPKVSAGLRLAAKREMEKGALKYQVQGVEAGLQHIVFAISAQTHQKISSPPLNIAVIEPVTLVPAAISRLFVGSTVQVATNAPHGIAIKYISSDKSVLSVSPEGVVEAVGQGVAALSAVGEVYDVATKAVCQLGPAKMGVEVAIFSGIKIAIAALTLFKESSMSVYAEGAGGETPLQALGSTRLEFHWASSDPSVLEVLPVYHHANVRLEDEADFSVWIKAKSPGRAKLTVTAVGTTTSQTYTDAVDIVVIDYLERTQPRPEAKTSFYLARRAHMQFETNMDGHCDFDTVGDKCPVTTSATGEVQAWGQEGPCIVVAKCIQEGVMQSALLNVYVAPVASLSVLPLGSTQPLFMEMTVGGEICLSITFQGRNGHQIDFLPTAMPVKVESSREGIVEIGPINLNQPHCQCSVMAVGEGSAVVRFSLEGESSGVVDDYLRVRVSRNALPSALVMQRGAATCLSLPASQTAGGQWTVSNKKVVSVGATTNGARLVAVDHGSATVTYKDTSSTKIDVTVDEVAKAQVYPRHTGAVPNTAAAKSYFEIKFYTRDNRQLSRLAACPPVEPSETVKYTTNVKYSCSFADRLLTATAEMDAETGQTFCVLSGAGLTGAARKKALTNQEGLLSVSVDGKVLTSHSVAIAPAFVVERNTIGSGTAGGHVADLVVYGEAYHGALQVFETEESGAVELRREAREGSTTYRVFSRQSGVHTVSITLRSRKTGQTTIASLDLSQPTPKQSAPAVPSQPQARASPSTAAGSPSTNAQWPGSWFLSNAAFAAVVALLAFLVAWLWLMDRFVTNPGAGQRVPQSAGPVKQPNRAAATEPGINPANRVYGMPRNWQ